MAIQARPDPPVVRGVVCLGRLLTRTYRQTVRMNAAQYAAVCVQVGRCIARWESSKQELKDADDETVC